MLRSLAIATVAISSVAAFQPSSTFLGNSISTQAACKSTGMHMSLADETSSVSRRAALGALLGGAIAVPGTAFAYVSGVKNQGRNYQLQNGGVLTDVASSSMAGTRVSGFREALVGNQERAKSFARSAVSETDIATIDKLTERASSRLSSKGYKTSNKIGINPAYGGSSGVFTGAE